MDDKRYHHPNLREDLIEAGIRIMNELGIEQLSLRKIALSCGVSHAAPYRHFADKKELLEAMQKYVEERFADILQKAVIDNQDAKHPMIEFGKAYVRFFSINPQYYQFFITHTNGYVKINSRTGEITSNYRPFTIFQAEAIKHFKEHKLPEHYYQTALMSMWSTVHGLASMAIMDNVEYDGSWENLAEKILIGVSRNE